MMTGRNGLYFLLRLGRLSYTIGFQSETLYMYQHPVGTIRDERSTVLYLSILPEL